MDRPEEPDDRRGRWWRRSAATAAVLGAVSLGVGMTQASAAPSPGAAAVPATDSPTTGSETSTPSETAPATTEPTHHTTETTSSSHYYHSTTTYSSRHSYSTSSTTYGQYGTSVPTTPTTVATTTTSTVAPLPKNVVAPPSTLPLTTKKQSAHVSPVLAELSGVGFFVALAILAAQAVLTRRRGRGRSL